MSADFHMRFRHSSGNLHIQASGGFDEEAARALLELLQREYRSGGRVFVDTASLDSIHPQGRDTLGTGLSALDMPAASLYFKGEKGFQVAPSGTRVLLVSPGGRESGAGGGRPSLAARRKKGHCCGRCEHCTCGHKHGPERTAEESVHP